jgi:hypothetical protein
LREVANARVHSTTSEVPAVRLEQEREHLQPLSAPCRGLLEPLSPQLALPLPQEYQHSLRMYEELIVAEVS